MFTKNLFIFFIFIFFLSFLKSQEHHQEKVDIVFLNDTTSYYFIQNHSLTQQRWDTLAQPNFWRRVMYLSPDSCIVNVAETREILMETSLEEWNKQTDEEKESYRDTLRYLYCLEDSTRIFVTSGKKDYYDFEGVIPSISKGVEIFEDLEVDPWYAQAILLIESPGKIQYSKDGAYGSFQLLKSVARKYGLEVYRGNDERKNFDRSAFAAASLIKESAIPEAKRILDNNCIEYDESELWFKLFVLHIYHAGAANVGALIKHMNPPGGGIDLITQMWQTEYGRFKNASQNYSQLALAACIELDRIIYSNCEYFHLCTPLSEDIMGCVEFLNNTAAD